MLRTGSGDSSGYDLASFRDEIAKPLGLLIVDLHARVCTEPADLAAMVDPSSARAA